MLPCSLCLSQRMSVLQLQALLFACAVTAQFLEGTANQCVAPGPVIPRVPPSSLGNAFYVAIPPAFFFEGAQLVIGTTQSSAKFVVETSTSEIANGEATFDNPAIVDLPTAAVVDSSAYTNRQKGIHIRTTGQRQIYVIVTIQHTSGFGSYLAYPRIGILSNEYKYFAVSSTSTVTSAHSQILLVSYTDGNSITITPKQRVSLPADAQDADSDMVDVEADTNHNVKLNKLQTLLISAGAAADLTGTKITASSQLTVISGHSAAKIPLPRNYAEVLAVQIPPVSTWGYEFLLAPFADRTNEHYFKVVAQNENSETTIIYKCGDDKPVATIISSGESFRFRNDPSTYCYLAANNRVQVVQLASGGTGDGGDRKGDPAIALVPPVQHHISDTRFTTLKDDQFTSHAISVTVKADLFRSLDILLDGKPLDCEWHEINDHTDCVVGLGCTMEISHGSHLVSHKGGGGLLSVMVYGFDTGAQKGYAYLAGENLHEVQRSESPNLPPVIKPATIDFLDLGALPASDLKELKREADSSSDPIIIPKGGIVFGNGIVSTSYVNENGAVSFNAPWKFSHPKRFPTQYDPTRTAYVAAPFWSDNDIRKEGAVRYAVIEKGSSGTGNNYLKKVQEFVRAKLNQDDDPDGFKAEWMVVAQWDKVHAFPHGQDDHQGIPEDLLQLTNTYQAVVVTGDYETHMLYTYTCREVEWSTIGSEPAVVGYNAAGDYFNNHRSSGYDTVNYDVACVLEVGNTTKRAALMNTVHTPVAANPAIVQALQACSEYEIRDQQLFDNTQFQNILNNAGPCPCTASQAQKDGAFTRDTDATNPTPTCYHGPEKTGQSQLGDVQYNRVCCYTTSGALATTDPEAGFIRITGNGIPATHDDDDFRQACCSGQSTTLCDKYTSRRPSDPDDCGKYTPPSTCTGGGDPHYVSVAGRRFDFHSDGEYLLLGIGGAEFQGILKRWGPAYHISFAFGEPGKFAYQVKDPNSYRFAVWKTQGPGAGTEITGQLASTGSTYTDPTGRLTMTRTSGSTIVASLSAGMSLTMTTYTSFLNFQALVSGPRSAMTGIVSQKPWAANNWRVTSSMFHVHRSAKESAYLVHQSETLDKIPEGPFEIDELDLEFTDEQIKFCKNDTQCLFDLDLTDDKEIAGTTKEHNDEREETTAVLNNFPPNATGESTYRVNIGEESTYRFHVVDDGDSFNVKVAGGVPPGATLKDQGGGDYIFTWNPTSREDVGGLTFKISDSEGADSELSPQVEVCACRDKAECILETVLDATPSLIIMDCLCSEAYSGRFCEEDKDGCAAIECFKGVECQDVPAPGVGAKCGSCPGGYTGDGDKCTDINECKVDPELCEHGCNNTIGSYQCLCEDGFEYDDRSKKCKDIDECKGINECDQTCENTEGSYECACGDGFSLGEDGYKCKADNPCPGDGGCEDYCAMVDGTATCFCRKGYIPHNFEQTRCVDLNECDKYSPCEGTCSNTEGSYECSCEDGYELLDDLSCADIDECLRAVEDGEDICPVNSNCVNSPGSYECACAEGLTLVDGVCIKTCTTTCPEGYSVSEDCSECVTSDICVVDNPCQNGGTCTLINPPNDYKCTCPENFSGKTCQECALSCNPGSAPSEDCSECVVTDICLARNPCKNGGTCQTTDDGFECICPEGSSGNRCQVALNFVSLRIAHNENDGTNSLFVEASRGPEPKKYYITLVRLKDNTKTRKANNRLRLLFDNLEAGEVYSVVVSREKGKKVFESIQTQAIIPYTPEGELKFTSLRISPNEAEDGSYNLYVESTPGTGDGRYWITLLRIKDNTKERKGFGDFNALFAQLSGGETYVVEVTMETGTKVRESITTPVLIP